MSDFELIQKAADRIYPTHLKEHTDSSFVWRNVLPDHFKKEVLAKSLGSKTKSVNSTHSLTTKTKDGGVIEFNLSPHGKSHIAIAKYQNDGKVYSAIHSHEDPKAALKTVYDSVKRRMVAEEIEPILVEKMAKRIEKKTGKLSDKKEKIDVEPSEEKELKESTPPGMESWVKKNKASFVKEYGEKKGHEVLYATAWKMHDEMNEMEELNELSKKTLGKYIKKAVDEVGISSNIAGGSTGLDHEGKHLANMHAIKRARGIKKAADKLAEAHTYTEQGLAKQIKYHENRAAHHDSEAQASFNRAQGLTGDKADLHFNVAKGHKAIADLHRKHIDDLKSSAGVNEAEVEKMFLSRGMISPQLADQLARESKYIGKDKSTGEHHYEHPRHGHFALVPHKSGQYQFRSASDLKEDQLNELSPSTLGRYIKYAAIQKANHAAHASISRMSQYAAENRKDKESAEQEKQAVEYHHKKEDKRTDGILRATDKLVRKASVKEDLDEAAHPDKIVMTSGIRKDLGGGYMAKTKSGNYYKLSWDALKLPNGSHDLPKLGSVLDVSKHKHIGKDKVDLNLLKEGFEIEPPEHVKAIGKQVHKTLHELGVHGKRVSYSYDSYRGPKHHRITVELGHYHPQEEKILDALQSKHAPYKFHYGPNDVEIETAAAIHPTPSSKQILKEEGNSYLGQVVGKYLTHGGKVGVEIRRHAIGTYNYSGEWGAGGGHSKQEMDKALNMMLRTHPRHKVEKHYHGDLHTIKESLDDNHPDMKAYHAACKARDEAHLASIRYRMNHDIKQPEHKTKYNELEAEHHRLRDIEDAAAEKVNGRLFAHHALKEQLISEAEEDHFKKVPEGLEWEPYSLRGYGSTEHGYKSKDGHWKVVPYHTTTYKKVKNTRLRDPGKTRYEFSAAVHHDGKWLGTKRFASVTGEYNRDKIEAGRQKMNTHMAKKIPNFNEYHVSH